MHVNGMLQNIFGTVALVSADNLASNACGGFKEGSTAYRFCRQCLVTLDESKKIVSLLISIPVYTFKLISYHQFLVQRGTIRITHIGKSLIALGRTRR